MGSIIRICAVTIAFFVVTSGCSPVIKTRTPKTPVLEATAELPGIPLETLHLPELTVMQGVTQNDISGNHIVSGSIDLQNASVIDIPLEGKPIWLVSATENESILLATVLEDGTTQVFKITGESYLPIEITPSQLPAGMPPLLTLTEGEPQLITPPADASLVTNPILLGEDLIYIASNGDLVVGETRLPVNALPDSRILADRKGRLLILSQPTDRYDHGVLGDDLEASAITLVETEPEVQILKEITIEEPDVIEGISPIWADINNDGSQDIIVTLSNNQNGARIVAFNEDGTMLAQSDPIGLGYRWRHQLAVAQFEANKPPLLVSIRTPHIGGVVEYFQYKGNGRLEIVKEFKGFSTHSIGSRNLDTALAADFNNDGVFEILIPDQSHTSLAIVSINEVSTALPLDGILTSNISAVNLNGRLYIAAGTEGKLRVWFP